MANNLVVQLLLKTGTFSTDLKQAKGQVQNFQKGCETAGKSLDAFGKGIGINIGALTKFGTVMGIAAAAGKGFKDVMESTQTTSDAFHGAIEGCKGVVDAFKISLASADFSRFQNGLWGIFDAAKAARDALDNLQDAQAYYGLLSSENRRDFRTAQEIYQNPSSTPAQKQQAVRDMEDAVKEGYELVTDLEKQTLKNFKQQVQTWAGTANIELEDINFDQLRTVARDFLKDADAATEKYKSGYNKMLADRDEYKVPFWEKQNPLGPAEYNNPTAVNNIVRNARDMVAGRAFLEMKDEDRQALIESVKGIDSAAEEVTTLAKTLDRVKNSIAGKSGGNGSKNVKEEIKLQEESLSWWNKIAQKAREQRDAEVYNSKSWNEFNAVLEEALGNVERINAETERSKTNAKYGDAYKDMLTPITGQNLTGQVVNTRPSGLAEDIKKEYEGLSINELKEKIKLYTDMAASVAGNSEELAGYNQKVAVLKDRVNELENVGLPSVQKETINTWDHFNDAMANTSEIVSNLAETFQEGTKVTAASILRLVSTSLPALSSLITAFAALAGVEATEKAVQTSKHWIEAIAAVAALGAAVATAISSAKSQKFANGGIVGGSSFTGDRVTAQVNSGEMILNKTQQANLFKMANSGVGGGGQVEFHISGTELVGVLNNQTRKNKLIR